MTPSLPAFPRAALPFALWAVLFAALLVGIVVASPAAAQGAAVRRVGLLALAPSAGSAFRTWTLPELAARGFVEGRNLTIDMRAGSVDEMPDLASNLAAAAPDVIVAVGGNAVAAAGRATGTIPIVSYGANPVQIGLADSLSHPGRNVTGLVIIGSELDAKRLQILAEAVPGRKRVGALVLTGSPTAEAIERDMKRFATALGLDLLTVRASGDGDYAESIRAMAVAGAGALVVTANPVFYRDTGEITRLALEAGLPTICEWREMAEQGCLLAYGPSRADLYRRTGEYVARILSGARPAGMPIEQPTQFELVLNQRIARSLGVELEPSVLASADAVIE